VCCAGHFLVASKFLCDLTHDVSHSDAHVVLLKCLADSEEVPIAVEHAKQIRGNSPSMLQVICTKLLAFSSSSSNPEPILHLLQALSQERVISIDFGKNRNDSWKHVCSKSLK
jgi:hypothetical protein